MAQIAAEADSSPSKGWVRDWILSFLTKSPGTTSEIAKELGVSKATVSYHMKALIRKGMVEIEDIKSIRGGVYSKTYALKQRGLTLSRRRTELDASLAELDGTFEKLLMSWHLDSARKRVDEVEIFLYHVFRLLAQSGSLDEGIFEDFGYKVGSLLIATSLDSTRTKSGIKELVAYLGAQEMAQLTMETKKGEDPRVVCTGCFQNKNHGSLVCFFTKGLLTGAVAARRGGRPRLDWSAESGATACTFRVKVRGLRR